MKKFLWLFVLITLTAPDGSPVWIAKEQVAAVIRDVHTVGGYGVPKATYARTEIFLTSGNQLYVKETPDQVAEKLQ